KSADWQFCQCLLCDSHAIITSKNRSLRNSCGLVCVEPDLKDGNALAEEKNQMKISNGVCAVCALLTLLIPLGVAQTASVSAPPLTDNDIQLLRSDVQADKNKIIADTMAFTDAESAAFWPVYREYAKDQQAIGDERVKLIKDYAQHFDSMDDAKAKDMSQRAMNVDAKFLNLRHA